MIRKASSADLNSIYSLLADCSAWLSQNGFHHWIGAIDKAKLMQNIEAGNVYLIEENECILATINLSTSAPTYSESIWPNSKAIYISKLAVTPSYMGKGYAVSLLEFAENLAKKGNINILHLDCVSHYKKLNDFYLKRGFTYVGSAKIDSRGTLCNFYEKII
ncbi:MAG: GNAT family N-acetyltransferase [Candidatus Bilamarchaeum sp.]|jgi:N-acetylglutamate synthase-like GNAT family acetyltransferase